MKQRIASFFILALLVLDAKALPVPEEGSSPNNHETKAEESKVYMDMLKLLQDVETSQAQLQEVVKSTHTAEERKDDDGTAAVDATPAKLLDMEKIVKALETVASTLQKGSKGLLADASSTDEAVLRNERDSGYGVPAYGTGSSGGAGETAGNFINVFSQAAANTVNFGTQLLNSLVSVAANILQGTVSTLLSLLNAKGQIVGAVVQSAPPVLASVTRTAGDVLAAKARIFGAVTQVGAAVANSFGNLAANVAAAKGNAVTGVNQINQGLGGWTAK